MKYYSIGRLAKVTNTSRKAIKSYQEIRILHPVIFERNHQAFCQEGLFKGWGKSGGFGAEPPQNLTAAAVVPTVLPLE